MPVGKPSSCTQICSSTTQHIPVFTTLLPLPVLSECHVYFVSANYNVWMTKDNRQYSQYCCHWPCWLLSCLTHSLFCFCLQCYRAHATHTHTGESLSCNRQLLHLLIHSNNSCEPEVIFHVDGKKRVANFVPVTVLFVGNDALLEWKDLIMMSRWKKLTLLLCKLGSCSAIFQLIELLIPRSCFVFVFFFNFFYSLLFFYEYYTISISFIKHIWVG